MTTKDEPLVSVVIASYNMSQYLPLSVQSVLNQTHENIEILIIDDGSTDGTRTTIERFLSDPRVKYFYQENKGQASAKNKGILESKGVYISFLDADDLWPINTLENQIPCFALSPAIGVVYGDIAVIDENNSVIALWKRKSLNGRISGPLLVDNFIGMACVIRRDCFEKVGLFDEQYRMGIDYDLLLRISAHYEFHYFNGVTYHYRRWSGQMSHNYKKRFECAIKIMNSFLERYPDLLDKAVVNEAWAHTYVSKGKCIAQFEKDKISAFREYIRALQYTPTYIPAMKEIIKLFVRR
jgi:glycosyltransferase involved in cell wall biosynthesis